MAGKRKEINWRASGRRTEDKAIAKAKEMGYVVERPNWGGRFQKNKDFFNLFDFWAMNDKQHLLVQVKTNYCPPAVRKAITVFKVPPFTVKQVWVWQKKTRTWKITTLY